MTDDAGDVKEKGPFETLPKESNHNVMGKLPRIVRFNVVVKKPSWNIRAGEQRPILEGLSGSQRLNSHFAESVFESPR